MQSGAFGARKEQEKMGEKEKNRETGVESSVSVNGLRNLPIEDDSPSRCAVSPEEKVTFSCFLAFS